MSRTFRATVCQWPSGKEYQRYVNGRKRAFARDRLRRDDYDGLYDYPPYNNCYRCEMSEHGESFFIF
jgi:hypothetical protein